MERKNLELTDNMMDVIIKMSEGNPGGLDVLMKIVEKEKPHGLLQILALDDMNIRGTQIWLGYKDFSGSDIDTFIENIKSRNKDMIALINKEGKMGNHEWKAVHGGASSSREMLQ